MGIYDTIEIKSKAQLTRWMKQFSIKVTSADFKESGYNPKEDDIYLQDICDTINIKYGTDLICDNSLSVYKYCN